MSHLYIAILPLASPKAKRTLSFIMPEVVVCNAIEWSMDYTIIYYKKLFEMQ